MKQTLLSKHLAGLALPLALAVLLLQPLVLRAANDKMDNVPNLVQNGTFGDDFDSWTNTGSDDQNAILTDETTGNKYWKTSYRKHTLTQTIDLADYFADNQTLTTAYVSCDVLSQYPTLDQALIVQYECKDAESNSLSTCTLVDGGKTFTADTWYTKDSTFTLPSGTRFVTVSLIAQGRFWKGTYGPAFDNVVLKVFPDFGFAVKQITVSIEDAASFVEPTLFLPTDYKGNVTWTSSDTSLATVDESGKVTYVADGKAGNVTITASCAPDETAQYSGGSYSYTILYKSTYKVNVVAKPAEGGSVVLSESEITPGRYVDGTAVTLTAVPSSGYVFMYWDDDHTLTDASRTFTITRDTTFTAIFKKELQSLISLDKSYAVLKLADGSFTPPTVNGLPDDYTSTATYKSSSSAYGVDESGNVTWQGSSLRPSSALSYIYINYLETDTYAPAQLQYYISTDTIAIIDSGHLSDYATLRKNWGLANYDEPVTLKLETDVTLTDSHTTIENFYGTFDGQGHTITLKNWISASSNYLDGDGRSLCSVFSSLGDCTIKNVRITGSITTKWSSDKWAPLAWRVNAGTADKRRTVNIINCHSDVSWKKYETKDVEEACGFINFIRDYADVTFTDCSSTVAFNDTTFSTSGGFIADQYSGNSKITFNNCLASIRNYSPTASASGLGYFVGNAKNEENLSGANNYVTQVIYNTTTDAQGVETADTLKVPTFATAITADQLKSGEVTYALNNGRKGDKALWKQNIGTDTIPQTLTFAPESKEVFYAEESTYRDYNPDGNGTLFYPVAVALPKGLKAFTVEKLTTNGSAGTLELSDAITDSLPANTAAILHVTVGEEMPEAITLPTTYYNKVEQDKVLTGLYEMTASGDHWYTLSNRDGQNGFYPFKGTLQAFRCYILEDYVSPSMFTVKFGGEPPTGISNVNANNVSGKTYNLAGQEIQTAHQPGIYIKNGKKFVVR